MFRTIAALALLAVSSPVMGATHHKTITMGAGASLPAYSAPVVPSLNALHPALLPAYAPIYHPHKQRPR